MRDRLKPRTWKHVPIWGIPVTLRYAPARVACVPCGQTRVEAIPWSQGKCRLGYLDQLNLRCNRAYLLKESFREFWEYKRKGWAKRFLKKWFWWATHSRLKPMRDFAWMLRRHEEGILNYFKEQISNGAVEGMNNKAKVVSHRCYGFRTARTYITNLYHCLGNLPEPVLVHRFL